MSNSPWSVRRDRATVAMILTLGLSACADVSSTSSTEASPDPAPATQTAPDEATLSLVLGTQSAEGQSVELRYSRGPDQPAPRMMELHVRVTGSLRYLRAERLAAAELASKDLVVQSGPDGTLRVIVYTTANTNRIGAGPLARLWFEHGAGTVTLLSESPIFAPPEADLGVVLGQPLDVGGTP